MASTVETVPELKLNSRDIQGLADELERYHSIYSPLFARREQRHWAKLYLQGLLSDLPRKSIEPMALELIGPRTTHVRTLQQFISIGAWEDRPILQRHWSEVDSLLGEEDAALIVDGSDFPKQGKASVGVKRQHCGELGKKANCQAGVFLAYCSTKGYTLLDSRLYLPEDWATDEEFARRRRRCGVPEAMSFKTKPELGAEMVEAVHASGRLRCRWVLGDAAFGHDTKFLERIDSIGLWYLAEVQHSDRVWLNRPKVVAPNWEGRGKKPGPKQTRPHLAPGEAKAQTVTVVADQLASHQWQLLTIKEGSKGPQKAEFAALRVVAVRDHLPGPDVWLVLRRNIETGELKAYVSNAGADVPLERLARLSGMRWPIETCFEDGKQLLGMGDYEVRSWRGWHHHMTMVILAHMFLVRMKLKLKKSGGLDIAASGNPLERNPAETRGRGEKIDRPVKIHAATKPRRVHLTPQAPHRCL
ncbi:MAG TPA: IS701 family transposase [Methylomirabilota bacterium]|nr:IS701 family transposase [Methylomirabilota bacterium]